MLKSPAPLICLLVIGLHRRLPVESVSLAGDDDLEDDLELACDLVIGESTCDMDLWLPVLNLGGVIRDLGEFRLVRARLTLEPELTWFVIEPDALVGLVVFCIELLDFLTLSLLAGISLVYCTCFSGNFFLNLDCVCCVALTLTLTGSSLVACVTLADCIGSSAPSGDVLGSTSCGFNEESDTAVSLCSPRQ